METEAPTFAQAKREPGCDGWFSIKLISISPALWRLPMFAIASFIDTFKKRRKSRFEVPFALLRLLANIIMKLAFRLETRGALQWQNQPGGVILAGNHTGYLDSLALLAACARPFYFLMRHEVFDWDWVGPLVPYGNIIPLYGGRERRGLVETVRYLRNGGAVCIFPEGKLSADGGMAEFNPGVAYLQEKSGRPIVPFAICGGYDAWAEGRPFPRFRPIAVVFGEPILPNESVDRNMLTRLIQQRVQALLDTHELGREPMPDNTAITEKIGA
jgi:1-acyl-sn-glycerol-3-phosphate acyltransferase